MVAAPSSNNVENAPDPECVSPRRESSGTFAMNAHIGADAVMDLVHTVKRTAANGADVSQVLGLLDGEEDRLHGDPVYIGVEKRLEAHRPEMRNARYSCFMPGSGCVSCPMSEREADRMASRIHSNARTTPRSRQQLRKKERTA